jgi:hypothetical protein
MNRIPTNAKAREFRLRTRKQAAETPFGGLFPVESPKLSFDSKRSYHRTGAEYYYASTTTCKSLETFFLQLFDKVKQSSGKLTA